MATAAWMKWHCLCEYRTTTSRHRPVIRPSTQSMDGRSACMSLNEWSELFRRTAGRPPGNLLQAYVTSTFSRHDCHLVFSGNPRWPQMLVNFKTSLLFSTGFAWHYWYMHEQMQRAALSTQRKPDRFTCLVSLLPGRQIRFCFLSACVSVSVSVSVCLSVCFRKNRHSQDFRCAVHYIDDNLYSPYNGRKKQNKQNNFLTKS